MAEKPTRIVPYGVIRMEVFLLGWVFALGQLAATLGTARLHHGEYFPRVDHWQLAIFTSVISFFIFGWCLALGFLACQGGHFSIWEFALAILLHDAYFYGCHKWLHTDPLYQKVHWLHHLHRKPGAWTAMMMHPIEAGIDALFFILLPLVIPMGTSSLTGFFCFMFATNLVGHLSTDYIKRMFPAFHWKAINDTSSHTRHHQEVTANLGAYTTFWDRWAGSYRSGSSQTRSEKWTL